MTGGPDDFLAKDENASISSSMNDSAYMSQAESRRQSRLRHTMNDHSAANGAVFQPALSSPSMSSDNYAITSGHPSEAGQYVLPPSSLTTSQQDQGTMSVGWTNYPHEADMSQRQVPQPHNHGYPMPQYPRNEGAGNNSSPWQTTVSQPTNGAYSMGAMDPSMFMPYTPQGPVYTQPLYMSYPSYVSSETVHGSAMAPPRRLAHEHLSLNTNSTAATHFDPATSSLTPTTARSTRRDHGRRTSAFDPNSAFDAASEISHADSFLTEPYSAVASERGHAEVQRASARQSSGAVQPPTLVAEESYVSNEDDDRPLKDLPNQAALEEAENKLARAHPLYQATTQSDDLYHCPYEGQSGCTHKPTKLKCNYDKYVDSHLRPFRCKVTTCIDVQFSSTACLLRHEREAHGMHGHGSKPHLCTYTDCERSIPGNGFPRRYNLFDHMKRVHDYTGPTTASGEASPVVGTEDVAFKKTAGRKRKSVGDGSEQPAEKRQKPSLPKAHSSGSIPTPQQRRAQEQQRLQQEWSNTRALLQQCIHNLQKPQDIAQHRQALDNAAALQRIAERLVELG